MMYAIKVKSQKRWDSLLKELEEKGWSWYSGHKPSIGDSEHCFIPTWDGDGNDWLSLYSESYTIKHSGKADVEGYEKIKDLDQLPSVESFQVRVTSKKELKSTLRHLAVRGYKWPSCTPILTQWLKLWSEKSGASEFGESMWLRVNRETGRMNWDNEKFKEAKEISLDVFDLPFFTSNVAFTSWKSFKKAMKILEKEGFKWRDGQKPTEWTSDFWDKKDFKVDLLIEDESMTISTISH